MLQGNNTAYDLDSLAPSWDPLRNAAWVSQNIVYVPDAKPGVPGLLLALSPATDVLMGARGPWTYQDCLNAHWDTSYTDNPNTPQGPALDVRHGMCIKTVNTSAKHDGGHLVLIVVKARTSTELTLEVTVWK